MSLRQLACARLRHRPFRSLATILGVTAVAGLASAALMVQAAGQDFARTQPGEPLITMQAGRICPSTSHLDRHLGDQIRQQSGVTGVIGQLVVVSDCKISTTATTFRGVLPGEFLAQRQAQLQALAGDIGAWGREGALVGQQVAKARGVGVGDLLESAGYAVPVVAIIDGTRMQDRASVWVHRDVLTERLPALKEVQTLYEVHLGPDQDTHVVSQLIDQALAGVSTTAPFSQAAARVAGSLGEVLRAGGAVAFAAAIAGVLLLINSTILSLRTSSRDLGILRAIGYGPVALATVVGVEGGIMGFIGGILGSVLAVLVVQQSATAISTEGVSVVIDPRWLQAVIVVLVATVLGMAASAIPAIVAIRGRLKSVLGGG